MAMPVLALSDNAIALTGSLTALLISVMLLELVYFIQHRRRQEAFGTERSFRATGSNKPQTAPVNERRVSIDTAV